MSEHIAASNAAQKLVLETISGARAAENITTSTTEDPKVVGFDEVEAARLGVKLQQTVSVTPSDNGTTAETRSLCLGVLKVARRRLTGKVPTIGPLIALNKEEITIQTEGSAGAVYCHFPRLYYVVKPEAASKL